LGVVGDNVIKPNLLFLKTMKRLYAIMNLVKIITENTTLIDIVAGRTWRKIMKCYVIIYMMIKTFLIMQKK
jgi:hypothetical protein